MSWATYIAPSCSERIPAVEESSRLSLDSVNNANGIQVVLNCDFAREYTHVDALVCHTSLRLTASYKDTIIAPDHTSFIPRTGFVASTSKDCM